MQLVDVVKENFITVRHDGGSRDRHDGPWKNIEKIKLNIFWNYFCLIRSIKCFWFTVDIFLEGQIQNPKL